MLTRYVIPCRTMLIFCNIFCKLPFSRTRIILPAWPDGQACISISDTQTQLSHQFSSQMTPPIPRVFSHGLYFLAPLRFPVPQANLFVLTPVIFWSCWFKWVNRKSRLPPRVISGFSLCRALGKFKKMYKSSFINNCKPFFTISFSDNKSPVETGDTMVFKTINLILWKF